MKSNHLYKLAALIFALGFNFAFTPIEICPYQKLARLTTNEIFYGVGAIAPDQNILHYEPLEIGQYNCIDDVYTCTYYLDWDGYIRQCEQGYFVP